MKEYDQQITELKKENFSLKLRIYFLEERMQQKYGDGEDVFKTNIELKVAVQSLKKDLEDKQELLRKASQAMETLTSSQQSDIEVIRKSMEEEHRKHLDDLRSDLHKALQEAEDCRQETDAARQKLLDMEVKVQQLEAEHQQSCVATQKLKDALNMKERELSELRHDADATMHSLEQAQRLLREAEEQREAAEQRAQQVAKDLERRGRDVEQLSTALKDTSMIDGQSFLAPTHLQDVVDDQQDALARLEAKVTELQEALNQKEDMVGRLEDGLREKDKAWKEAANKAEQLAAEMEQEQEYGNRRDKTIQGLVASLHKKEKEVKSVKEKLSKTEEALKSVRDELHEAQMEKHKELQQLQDELAYAEDSNGLLQTQLSVANADAENMIRSLGKKEGELAGFRDQLQQANQALKRSEEALEALQEQLQKERDEAHTKLDSQTQHYQHMLEDYMRQVEGKDSLMAHMTAQLRAKDQQLTSLMDLLTEDTNKGQKAVLQRLEDGLNKSADNVQSALEEKQTELEQKSRELRDAKQALQDKGRELGQASLDLLDRQQELERLQMRTREQTEATSQLSAALARAQNMLEESIERHAATLKEKDGIVQRLQNSLAEKERMIEDLMNRTPAVDKEHQQLRAQLRDKDQLIQELQTECVRASCDKDKLAGKLQAQLQEKDAEIETMTKKQQKELMNRDQELQQLTAQLGRKDMQLQNLESRMALAEEQQQEAVDRLRRMMLEKDRTIEALMDSVAEKERLLRRSQQNLTEDAKAQIAEMDTLMAENAQLKRLLKEREAALEDLRRGDSNTRDTHRTSYHETVTHTVGDNSQVCRLLEEQVRETHALCELLRQDRPVSVTLSERHSDFSSREDGFRDSQAGGRRPELSAVEKLCQRLEAGVDRNQLLHRSLLGHTARHPDHLTSSESSVEGGHLDSRHHPYRFDDVDGYPSTSASSTSTASNNNTPACVNRNGSPPRPVGGAQAHSTNSLSVQTSPVLLRGVPVGDDGCQVDFHTVSSQTSTILTTGSEDGRNTRLCECPSSVEHLHFEQALEEGSQSSLRSLSSAQLEGMSAAVLRDLVSQLQEDLVAAAQQNSALTRQLQALNHDHVVDGDGDREERSAGGQMKNQSCSPSVDQLQAEVESLRQALHLKDEEMSHLRQHVGLPGSASGSGVDGDDLHEQVRTLRRQVKDMSRVNDLLKQQIALNSQSEDAPQGFNPQLIVEMAAEIERLKAENSRGRREPEERFSLERSGQRGSEQSSPRGVNGITNAVVSGHASSSSSSSARTVRKRSRSPTQTSPPATDHLQALSSAHTHSPTHNQRTDSDEQEDLSPTPPPHSTYSLSSTELDRAPRLVGAGEVRAASSTSRLAKLKLSNADSAKGQPLVSVTRRLQDSQEQVRSLEERLRATEGTVRYMSQRLRHYKALAGGQKKEGLPRSRSDACLSSQPSVSLSFSCSDLQEVGREAGPGFSSSTALGFDSATLLPDSTADGDFLSGAHMMIDLQEQIRALRERHAQEIEARDRELAHLRLTARQPPPGQEEDGGANSGMNDESSWVSSVSRETMRRDDLPSTRMQIRQSANPYGVCKAGNTSLNASRPVSDPSQISASACSEHTDTTSLPSSRHHGDMSTLVVPEDITLSTTLGEDVHDGNETHIDNLTYSSFSESILPVGTSHVRHDSAWSSPRIAQLRNGSAAQARRVNTEPQAMSPLVRSDGVGGREQFSVKVRGDGGSPNGSSDVHGHSILDDMQCGEGLDQSMASADAARLQAKVMVLTDMNRTMREELRIYDSMCRSLGVQVTPGASTGVGSGESSGDSDGEIRLLQLHLTELRRLRGRLEQLDTEAHTAVQVSSLLNDQHVRRISELEALLSQVRNQLAEQEALSTERQATIVERERVIKETTLIVERREKEAEHLQEKIATLQASGEERDAATEELRRQLDDLQEQLTESQEREEDTLNKLSHSQKEVEDLSSQLRQTKQRAKSIESELAQFKQHSKALELKLTKASQQQKDLEFRLSESEQERLDAESKLSQAQRKVESLESSLAGDKVQASALGRELEEAKKRLSSVEADLTETRKKSSSLTTELAQSKKHASILEIELKKSGHQRHLLDSEKKDLQLCKERLESDLAEVRREVQIATRRAADLTAREEECMQLKQRVQHFQERMVHYEECMREYQQQAADSEDKVRELQDSLRNSHEQREDMKSELHSSQTRIQHLETQLKETEDHARFNESIAHRADTLARTLESRVRDLEGKVREAEDQARSKELQVREGQVTLAEQSNTIETLRQETSERNAKLKKRDAQLKKLVEEYKKVTAAQKEVSQLNQTLKCELKLYETMHSQTEMSRDKKEELMRQLLSELSQTRRLAEDLITRLEHTRHNESPPSTNGGPEAADGRPSPEPRDGVAMTSTTTSLRIHTESVNTAAESLAMPRVEVDSDIRRLFAVSGLESYEKLRRESSELISILCSMQARLSERLKTFTGASISESVEYSTLRELQMAAQNLRICAEEESRLLAGFWLTQLPPLNARGEFYDPKAAEENENLRVELRKQKSRYDLLAHTVREQQERLHATNALRKKWETTLYKQLSHTTQVLGHAKENFDQAGLTPPKDKSPRKSQPQRKFKDKN
nr:hypothetical protein BaRGS_013239 [Batillaria attramentaria]